MNNVRIFTFRKMPVRAVERNGENFFVIRDICNILGWSNPNRELAKHTENIRSFWLCNSFKSALASLP